MRARDAFAAIAFLVLGPGTAPAFAEAGACVRAAVEEPFLLPDGSWHDAGPLRICLDRAYSPVSDLHTIQAADGAAGAFLGRRGAAESPAPERAPRILFARDGNRRLTLLGYAVATGGTTRIYWMEPSRRPGRGGRQGRGR